MAKKHDALGPGPDWLKRHTGPIQVRLLWIADDIRASRTKAERLDLAAALDGLSREVMLKEPIGRRGRPGKRFSVAPGTSTFPGTNTARALAGIANRLMRNPAVTGKVAVDAALKAVGNIDAKFRQTVERTLRKLRRGEISIVSWRTEDYEAAERCLRQVHRIK